MKSAGMKSVLRNLIMAALVACAGSQVNADTTLLPPGVQCWATPNGPLVAGTVNTYIPSTTTNKATYRDANQVSTNANPVVLDANGCGIIFGKGAYRLLVKDSAGATVYDVLTTDTSSTQNIFWADLAGGTPNAITVVDTGFNSTSGSIINFLAIAANTSATTLNPSGAGAKQILKATSSTNIPLTGGEIINGMIVSVIFYSACDCFVMLNNLIQTTGGSSAPLCGATGLVITNNSGTPNTSIDVTWSSAVTISNAGAAFNLSTPTTVTINSTASGSVNQWDAARPTSNWGYIWLVGNGSTMGAIGSASSTAPTLPSGYTYKCRVGAMQFNGAQNLARTRQAGSVSQYQGVVIPNLGNGITGTYSTTSPVLATATVAGATSCAPPTATAAHIVATGTWKGGGGSSVLVAPGTAWGGTNNGPQGSAGQQWPIWVNGAAFSVSDWLVLEGTTIAWAADAAGGAVSCSGWRDAVNAN